MPAVQPLAVESRPGYRVWLRYADGSEDEVDLSDLAGHGVFEAWTDPVFYDAVRLTSYGSIAWGDDIELCADALYLELTGLTVQDLVQGPGGQPDND